MINLNELNEMLDKALDTETTESLNRWIAEQIEKDLAVGIISEADVYDQYSKESGLDKSTIEAGMNEYVAYRNVIISDSFDTAAANNTNFAA